MAQLLLLFEELYRLLVNDHVAHHLSVLRDHHVLQLLLRFAEFVDPAPVVDRLAIDALIRVMDHFAVPASVRIRFRRIEPVGVRDLLPILARLPKLDLYMVLVQVLRGALVEDAVEEVLDYLLGDALSTLLRAAKLIGYLDRTAEVVEDDLVVLFHLQDGFFFYASSQAIGTEVVVAIVRQNVTQVEVLLRPGDYLRVKVVLQVVPADHAVATGARFLIVMLFQLFKILLDRPVQPLGLVEKQVQGST